MEKRFWLPMPGDILLTRNRALGGRANSAYQRMRRLRYLCIAIEFTPTHAALVLGTDQIVHSTKHAKSAGKRPEIGLRDLLQLILAFKRGGHEELKWHPKYLDLIHVARRILRPWRGCRHVL